MKRWTVWIAGVLLGACSGSSGSPGSSDDGEVPDDGSDVDDVPGEDEEDGTGQEAPCRTPDDELPPIRLGRLTQRQYVRTLSATFGVAVDPTRIPADPPSGEGFAVFDTMLSDKSVGEQHFNAYAGVAEETARALVPKVEAEVDCVTSAPDLACGERVATLFGERAFRRPLDAAETTRYATFFADAGKRWDGRVATRMLLEVLLQSPHHLYRTELGAEPVAEGRVSLTNHEIASQLSYMLTDGPPDAELMAAAREGKLTSRTEVMRQARRLLGDANLRLKMTEFFGQMLGVTPMLAGNLGKDQTAFPAFSPALRDAMLAETATFVEKVLFEEDGKASSLFGARHSYLDKAMAQHYGASAPSGAREKVSLPPARRGLLGHASVLAVTSHADHTSPASRGMLVYGKLLCRERPVAPPGAIDSAAGKVISPEPELTQREHWEFALKNAPQCTACHGEFVPIGLGLEQFDAVGAHRASEYGKTLDTRVSLSGYGDADGDYADTLALGEALVASEHGQRCLATQLQAYALGATPPAGVTSCEAGHLGKRFAASDLRVLDLLADITAQDSFYHRRSEP